MFVLYEKLCQKLHWFQSLIRLSLGIEGFLINLVIVEEQMISSFLVFVTIRNWFRRKSSYFLFAFFFFTLDDGVERHKWKYVKKEKGAMHFFNIVPLITIMNMFKLEITSIRKEMYKNIAQSVRGKYAER